MDKNMRPFITNGVRLVWNDKDGFFSRYAIVSYVRGGQNRNIAYEHLSSLPCLSVMGIRNSDGQSNETRFFILCAKGNEKRIINCLRDDDDIKARIEDERLEELCREYGETAAERVILSLVINSIGMVAEGRKMYNDRFLYVNDDMNFGFSTIKEEYKKDEQLVCLRLEVTGELILSISTKTFSHPSNALQLRKNRSCVFTWGRSIRGDQFFIRTLKRVVVDKDSSYGQDELKNLWIEKKPNNKRNTKNTVPWLPADEKRYKKGKLFVLWEVVKEANKRYSDLLRIEFNEVLPFLQEKDSTESEIKKLCAKYLNGTNVVIEIDPAKESCDDIRVGIIHAMNDLLGKGVLSFTDTPKANSLVLKFIEDEESYDRGDTLRAYIAQGSVIQHIDYAKSKWSEGSLKSFSRRILQELLVKRCIIQRTLPLELLKEIEGWSFSFYKYCQDNRVRGCSLSISANGEMEFSEHGIAEEDYYDYVRFSQQELPNTFRTKGRNIGLYVILKNRGNIYIITSTEEVPIPSPEKLRHLFDERLGKERVTKRGGEESLFNISLIRRKEEQERYLSGYSGISVWQRQNDLNPRYPGYAYIAGKNIEKRSGISKHSNVIEKMPHVRYLYPIAVTDDTLITQQVMEIIDMLKHSFGQYGEVQALPFIFKFMEEYVEEKCLCHRNIHWDEL